MLRKLTFYLLVLFAVYSYITMTDASGTAEVANSFFDWLGEGLDKTRAFVNSALGDDDSAVQT